MCKLNWNWCNECKKQIKCIYEHLRYMLVHLTFLKHSQLNKLSFSPPTVRKKSCLHPPVKKTRVISGRMRICLAKWSVWRGSPPGTKRRPRGTLLWWAHSLPSFTALCSISVNKPGPLLLVLHSQHCAISSTPACVTPGRIMWLTLPSIS